VETAAANLGITLAWEGTGVHEKGIVSSVDPAADLSSGNGSFRVKSPCVKPGDVIVAVDPMYFRPAEVETLLGDAAKAQKKLGWEPCISFADMVKEMVCHDLEEAKRDALCRQEGFAVCNFYE
jgi:GDPmannose 4,6-dehydratase